MRQMGAKSPTPPLAELGGHVADQIPLARADLLEGPILAVGEIIGGKAEIVAHCVLLDKGTALIHAENSALEVAVALGRGAGLVIGLGDRYPPALEFIKKTAEDGKVEGIQFQITGSDGSSTTLPTYCPGTRRR